MLTKRTILLLAILTGLNGCREEFTVLKYPDFYRPALRTVAVVPFANDAMRPEAGEFFARRLAHALSRNGTYEVTGPNELASRLRAAGIEAPEPANRQAVLDALRHLGGFDALVAGRVTGFSSDQHTEVDVDYPYYGHSYWGGYGYGGYWRGHPWHGSGFGYRFAAPVYYTRSYAQGYAAVTAELVRLSDGKTLHETAAPISARVTESGDPPPTGDEVLTRAADETARRLVRRLAVAPVTVEIDPGMDFRLSRRTDAGLKDTDDFGADENEMVVSLRLPPEADRNDFRLAVARKGDGAALDEREFQWSKDRPVQEFAFSPRDLAAKGGTGHFEARLHVGDELVAKRDFEIE